jgi:hypothetical protein
LITNLINVLPFVGCQGRLCGVTNSPFPADQFITSIYLVPCRGNLISFYTPGFGWNNYPILGGVNTPTLALGGLNVSKCYDVFAYWDGSKVVLTSIAWTNLISRASPLTFQDGVYTLTSDQSKLYLGTFSPNSSSQVADQVYERGLWNYFNRVQKSVKRTDTTTSWSYALVAWEVERGQTNPILVTKGIAEDADNFDVWGACVCGATLFGLVGIGVDSPTVNSADVLMATLAPSAKATLTANLRTTLSIGQHSIYWLESCSTASSVTFYGLSAANQSQSGLIGLVWC